MIVRVVRAGRIVAVVAAALLLVAGCFDASLAHSANAPASLSIQQAPAEIQEVTLTVGGPGMGTITETVGRETDVIVLEIPVGPDRVFEGEADGYTARTVQDVPAGGTEVSLVFVPPDPPDDPPADDPPDTGDDNQNGSGTDDDPTDPPDSDPDTSDPPQDPDPPPSDPDPQGPAGTILFTADWDGDFENDEDIYRVGTSGTGTLEALTDNSAENINDRDPVYTPDGSQIVFGSDRDNAEGEIYAMDADGSNLIRLTDNTDTEESWAVSPDGSTVAFATSYSEGFGSNRDIYTVPLSGGSPTPIREQTGILLSGTGGEIQWSPDGTKLLYIADEDDDGFYEIRVMGSDGSSPGVVVESQSGESISFITVSWLTSDRIVYVFERTEGAPLGWFLYSVSADPAQPDPAELAQAPSGFRFHTGPQSVLPSPDGSAVSYIVRTDDYTEVDLYVVDASGDPSLQLTDGLDLSFELYWSPDSSRIAIAEQSPAEVGFVEADGSGSFEAVTNDTAEDGFGFEWRDPWSPDGTWLAFEKSTGTTEGTKRIPHVVDVSGSTFESVQLFDPQSGGGSASTGTLQWQPQP